MLPRYLYLYVHFSPIYTPYLKASLTFINLLVLFISNQKAFSELIISENANIFNQFEHVL